MLLISVSYNCTLVKKLPQCWFENLRGILAAWERGAADLCGIQGKKKVIYVG